MLPILQIGPLALRTPGLLLILGAYLALELTSRLARRRGDKPDAISDLVLLAVLGGLVFARLAFVLTHLPIFQNDLAALVSLDASLLDPWGGVAGALILALVYAQRKRLPFWGTLDRLVPFLAVMAVFIGLANAARGSAYGAPSSLPWAVALWGESRHPSQLYAALGALAILALVWRSFTAPAVSGELFLKFTALTAGMGVFLAAFRGDSALVFGNFRLEQILALILLALALALLEFLPRFKHPGADPAAAQTPRP